jgi:hypothetical protein
MVLFSLTSYTAPQVGLRAAPYLEALAVLLEAPLREESNESPYMKPLGDM